MAMDTWGTCFVGLFRHIWHIAYQIHYNIISILHIKTQSFSASGSVEKYKLWRFPVKGLFQYTSYRFFRDPLLILIAMPVLAYERPTIMSCH